MDDNVKQWILDGKELYGNKDYDGAERVLRKVVKHSRAFADVLNMLGVIYHHKGRYNLAQQAFEEALAINPHYIEASLNLAVIYNDMGQYAKARDLYARAVERTSRDQKIGDPFVRGKIANMHAQLGDVYASMGLHLEASREFGQALDLCPTFADIRTKLANVLRDSGRVDEALAEYDRAIAHNERYLSARINRGITLYSLGRVEEAVREWSLALRLDPENKICQMYLNLDRSRRERDQGGD